MILLNELTNEARNASLKCFASRREERRKAFLTIKQTGFLRISVAFGQTVVGLWRLLMHGSLNSPELEGLTPELVALLGWEWLDFLVDTMSDDELSAIPKLEHLLVQGRQEGEATMLMRQLQCRFGVVPDWVQEKVLQADSKLLEAWSLRFVEAQTLEEVFAD